MSWFNKLERKLEPFAIPNITLFIIIGQAGLYLAELLGVVDIRRFIFLPALAISGEPWRFLTFIWVPPAMHWAFIAFGLYFLYFAGTALESYWGVFRYNLFLLSGYLLTIGLSFVTPLWPASNVFIGGAIFLAFAYLNPDFQMYVLFVIPVRIKWLALLAWVGYAYSFVTGGLPAKLSVLAATGNFLIFFARDLFLSARGSGPLRGGNFRAKATRDSGEPRHRCHVCGKTDVTDPTLDFRYCSKCAGDQCYCPDHIFNHEHVREEETAKEQ